MSRLSFLCFSSSQSATSALILKETYKLGKRLELSDPPVELKTSEVLRQLKYINMRYLVVL
ncbi:hypothetical protein EJB05_13421, partial [Eragrostis curvula]